MVRSETETQSYHWARTSRSLCVPLPLEQFSEQQANFPASLKTFSLAVCHPRHAPCPLSKLQVTAAGCHLTHHKSPLLKLPRERYLEQTDAPLKKVGLFQEFGRLQSELTLSVLCFVPSFQGRLAAAQPRGIGVTLCRLPAGRSARDRQGSFGGR